MHDYGILKREGISIDNSVIKGNGANPYDKKLVASVAKYAEGIKIPFSNSNTFIEGIRYTIQKINLFHHKLQIEILGYYLQQM